MLVRAPARRWMALPPTPAETYMSVTRLAIIEDDSVTRQAMLARLASEPDFAIVGVAETFVDGMALATKASFDVLLIDLGLGSKSGVEIISECAKRSIAKILVVSSLGDEKSLVDAFHAGADGYILKDGLFSTIPAQIREALDGGAPISSSVARHLLKRYRVTTDVPTQAGGGEGREAYEAAGRLLSKRELQVLTALAQGYRYKEISERLSLSYHTIADYAKSLYRKLEVSSRGEAVLKASKKGIIHLPSDQ